MRLLIQTDDEVVHEVVDDLEEYDLEIAFARADLMNEIVAAMKRLPPIEVDPGDDFLLRDSESAGSGGAGDSDASYRSSMRDAGRGGQLR